MAIERTLILKARYDFSEAEADLAAHQAAVEERMRRAGSRAGGGPPGGGGGGAGGGAGGFSGRPPGGGGGGAGGGYGFVGGLPVPMQGGGYGPPANQPSPFMVRIPRPQALGAPGSPALGGPGGSGVITLPPSAYRVMGGSPLGLPGPAGAAALAVGGGAGGGGGGAGPYAGGLGGYYAGLRAQQEGLGGIRTNADGATRSVNSLGSSFLALAAGQAVVGSLRSSLEALGRQAAESRAYVAGIGDEVAAARKKDAELASYRGEKPTAMFAANVAGEGAAAGLDADRMRQFQLAFRGYAGQHIGNKIDEGQAQRLQNTVASYAVGKKGLNAEDSARLLGTIINKSKPGATDADIMGQYGQLLEVMQLAPGYTGPLLGQLSEVVGESVGEGGQFKDALDAGILVRAEAERNPRTASAYTRALLRGLRKNASNPDKAKALGITQGMDTFEQLDAVKKAMEASPNEDDFLDKYFPEIRQYGGSKTAIEAGIRGGAFARARKEAGLGEPGAREKFAKKVQDEAEGYRKSELGTDEAQNAEIIRAQREQAAKGVALRRFRKEAEIAVEGSGELKHGEGIYGAIVTGIGEHVYGMGDRRQQEINKITGENIRQGLQGYQAGREFLEQPTSPGSNVSNEGALKFARMTNETTLERCANELVKLRQIAEADRTQREKAEAVKAKPAIPMGLAFEASGRF
jgi:hypothetical protein